MSVLSQFLSTVETDAKVIVTTIGADIKSIITSVEPEEQAIVSYLEPLLIGQVGAAIKALIPVAESIVAALLITGTISDAARAAAIAQIVSAAETVGSAVVSDVEAVASMVYEFVLAKLKAATSAVVAPAGN